MLREPACPSTPAPPRPIQAELSGALLPFAFPYPLTQEAWSTSSDLLQPPAHCSLASRGLSGQSAPPRFCGVPGLLPARTLELCTHKALERRGGSYGGRRELQGLFKGKCTCGQLSAKVVSSLPRFCSKRFDFADAVTHSGPSAHTYPAARAHTQTLAQTYIYTLMHA